MTRHAELDAEIDRMTRDLQKSYDTSLEKIRKVKEKINSLEKTLDQENGHSAKRISELNRTTKRLNELSDFLIVESKKASERLSSLERKSESNGLELGRLNDLRVLCKKTELMAADFLCYTLGSFQRHTFVASSVPVSSSKECVPKSS